MNLPVNFKKTVQAIREDMIFDSRSLNLFDAKVVSKKQGIANLDQVREIILEDEIRFDMRVFHNGFGWIGRTCEEEASCGTAHCIAGWLQVCSTDPTVREADPEVAGAICAPQAVHMFYQSHDRARKWLINREYAKE